VSDATTNTFIPQAGDTMAEAKVRLSCYNDSGYCGARKLSSDFEYTDVWTTPPATTPEISIKYRDPVEGLSTPYPILNGGSFSAPAIASCIGDSATPAQWTRSCRIVINYMDHIQPLWIKSRTTDSAGNFFLDSTGAPVDYRCTNCHNTVDMMGVAQVPPGTWQLNLVDGVDTGGIKDFNPDWVNSYQELTTGSNNKFNRISDGMGGLIPAENCVTTTVTNADGTTTTTTTCTNDQTLGDVFNILASPVTPFSARRSYLIEKLTETELGSSRTLTPSSDPAYVDHSKMMTAAEIRLLSEWIDMGAPYYSNPYVVP